jgi:hypothetical protein
MLKNLYLSCQRCGALSQILHFAMEQFSYLNEIWYLMAIIVLLKKSHVYI